MSRPPTLQDRRTTHTGTIKSCRCEACRQHRRDQRVRWKTRAETRPSEVAAGEGYSHEVIARRVMQSAARPHGLRLSELLMRSTSEPLVTARRAAVMALQQELGWACRYACRLCNVRPGTVVAWPPGQHHPQPREVDIQRLARHELSFEAACETARAQATELRREEENETERLQALVGEHLARLAVEFRIASDRILVTRLAAEADARAELYRRLAAAGLTHKRIADLLGVWRPSVTRCLRRLRGNTR